MFWLCYANKCLIKRRLWRTKPSHLSLFEPTLFITQNELSFGPVETLQNQMIMCTFPMPHEISNVFISFITNFAGKIGWPFSRIFIIFCMVIPARIIIKGTSTLSKLLTCVYSVCMHLLLVLHQIYFCLKIVITISTSYNVLTCLDCELYFVFRLPGQELHGNPPKF